MSDLGFEDILPAANELCRLKARAAIGQCGLAPYDREDIEAQLLLALYVRFPRFDEGRASIRTFACRVLDREIASIFRYRLAQRRLHLGKPELVEDGDISTTHDSDSHTYSAPVPPPPCERQNFWLDVAKVTETLPAPLRETVLALRCGSPTEASRNLCTTKSVVYDRIARIRTAFLEAGISPAYFTPGGSR